jgi:hypothetical protein
VPAAGRQPQERCQDHAVGGQRPALPVQSILVRLLGHAVFRVFVGIEAIAQAFVASLQP